MLAHRHTHTRTHKDARFLRKRAASQARARVSSAHADIHAHTKTHRHTYTHTHTNTQTHARTLNEGRPGKRPWRGDLIPTCVDQSGVGLRLSCLSRGPVRPLRVACARSPPPSPAAPSREPPRPESRLWRCAGALEGAAVRWTPCQRRRPHERQRQPQSSSSPRLHRPLTGPKPHSARQHPQHPRTRRPLAHPRSRPGRTPLEAQPRAKPRAGSPPLEPPAQKQRPTHCAPLAPGTPSTLPPGLPRPRAHATPLPLAGRSASCRTRRIPPRGNCGTAHPLHPPKYEPNISFHRSSSA